MTAVGPGGRAAGGDGPAPLVSVIIPAYNAVATLAATARSALAQTWPDIEVVIVDDGSRDGTLALARSLEAADPRVRVIAKANGGVSAARNDAIRASRGAFIAPLDADDLWRPEKIERQMRRMEALGPACGFVYCLSHVIDDRDRVLSPKGVAGFEGSVFLRAIVVNFVGNGSAALFRRAAVEEAGGYQGHRSEDWLLQATVARGWTVGCVPERLVGYRRSEGSLSSDRTREREALLAGLDVLRARFPDTPADVLAAAEAAARIDIAVDALRRRRAGAAPRQAAAAFRVAPGAAAAAVASWLGRGLRAMARRGAATIGLRGEDGPGPDFFAADPLACYGRSPADRSGALLRRLGAREAQFISSGQRA